MVLYLVMMGSSVMMPLYVQRVMGYSAVYGDTAMMHGMNVSFLWMSVGAAVLFLIAVFAMREKK